MCSRHFHDFISVYMANMKRTIDFGRYESFGLYGVLIFRNGCLFAWEDFIRVSQRTEV